MTVAVIMGSKSDEEVMNGAVEVLEQFSIPYQKWVVSAHRTPSQMVTFSHSLEENGIKLVIAGAGGAAHLPGMVASMTHLPVIGVPIKTSTLSGVDSLYSIVQMPKGIPVNTMAINGAANAAFSAIEILSLQDEALKNAYIQYKKDLALSTWETQFEK